MKFFTIKLLACSLIFFQLHNVADAKMVILENVPLYDEEFFNDECSGDSAPTAAGMVLGWYDSNGWPSMVHAGSNSFEKNPIGVSDLVHDLSNTSGYICNQGTFIELHNISNAIKNTAKNMDSKTNFSTNPDEWVWFWQLKECINQYGPVYFNSVPGLVFYNDNDAWRMKVKHDMTLIGYDENGTYYNIKSDWIVLNMGWGDYMSPALVDFNNNGSDDLYDVRVFPGGIPSDDDDDIYEDNDSFIDAKDITLKTHSDLICQDEDWYRIYLSGGILKINLYFTHEKGDLDIKLYESKDIKLKSSTSSSNDEEIIHTTTYSGAYYIKVYGYDDAKNNYSLKISCISNQLIPTPSTNSNGIPVSSILSWKGGNSTETYDLYFGVNNDPQIIATDLSQNYYNLGILENSTTYYWKVVSKNGYGMLIENPVWNFTTISKIGYFEDGISSDLTTQAFIDAYSRNGGYEELGKPCDNGGGIFVHDYFFEFEENSQYLIYLQDVCHEINGQKTFLYLPGNKNAYLMQGCLGYIWWDYKSLIGPPSSDQIHNVKSFSENLYNDGYDVVQLFQGEGKMFLNSSTGYVKLISSDGTYQEDINACVPIKYNYYMNSSETIEGYSHWGEAIFKMSLSITEDYYLTATIEKLDSSTFSSHGYMYLQKDTYLSSSNHNIGMDYLNSGDFKSTISSTVSLDNINSEWNNNKIKIYARYENTAGAYAWVGPIYLYRSELTGSIKVNIEPIDARIAGAKWRSEIIGVGWTSWFDSGQLISGFKPWKTKIQFISLPGWESPQEIGKVLIGGETIEISVIYNKKLPETITDFSASYDIYPDMIFLKWNYFEDGISYKIFRSSENNDTETCIASEITKTSYYDKTTEPGIIYYYRVRAKNNLGFGEFSEKIEGRAALCNYSINPKNKIYNNAGGNGCFNITTSNICEWHAKSDNDWISITTEEKNGYGDGSICYYVTPNNNTQRNGSISVNNDTFLIQQKQNIALEAPCNLYLCEQDDSNEQDNITNISKGLTIIGSGKNDSSIQIFANGKKIDHNDVYVLNNKFKIYITLPEGYNVITANQTLYDNTSGFSEPLTIIVDTKASPPSDLKVFDVSGNSNFDNIFNGKKELIIQGNGEEGATISIFFKDDESVITSIVKNGIFYIKLSFEKNRIHQIIANQKDIAGNESFFSKPLLITIDNDEPSIFIDEPLNGNVKNKIWYIRGETIDLISNIIKVKVQITDGKYFFYKNENNEWLPTELPSWNIVSPLSNWDKWELYVNPIIWSENTSYTITALAADSAENTSTKSIIIDYKKALQSDITLELSKTSIVYGESLEISGVVNPIPELIGMPVFFNFSTTDDISYFLNSRIYNGKFSSTLECSDIRSSGDIIINASWNGNSQIQGASSNQLIINVSKAHARVILNESPYSIKIKENLMIKGKVITEPFCKKNMEGIPIKIIIFPPDNISESIVISKTTDINGHFEFLFTDINTPGVWSIIADLYPNNKNYTSLGEDSKQVIVSESSGFVIIITGNYLNSEGKEAFDKTTILMYKIFKEFNIDDQDIILMNNNLNLKNCEVDAYSEKQNIKYAITGNIKEGEEIPFKWNAPDHLNLNPANLYIAIIDHGSNGKFYIYPDNELLHDDNSSEYYITAEELGNWLDILQGKLEPNASKQEIVIFLGFCNSGSFIDSLSGNNRIIVASSRENELSFKGTLGSDGIKEGDFFISELFKGMSPYKSIKECFEEASTKTQIFTQKTINDSDISLYNNSMQHPVLHDPNNLSSSIAIGSKLNSKLFINEVNESIFLKYSEFSTNAIWAKVSYGSSDEINVWIEIKKSDYYIDDLSEIQLQKKIYDVYNKEKNRFEWNEVSEFSSPGIYQIFYYAEDINTGIISSFIESKVYKNKIGNSEPDPFTLIVPANNTTITPTYLNEKYEYIQIFDWKRATDPDHDKVTYTISLSTDESFKYSTTTIKKDILYSTCMMSIPKKWVDNDSIIFWKVEAIDAYGARQQTDVWRFQIKSANIESAGFLDISVFNSCSTNLITDLKLKLINRNQVLEVNIEDRYSSDNLSEGNYTVSFDKNSINNRFETPSDFDVLVKEGKGTYLTINLMPIFDSFNLDVDKNNKADALTDGILIIRYLFGLTEGISLLENAVNYNSGQRITEKCIQSYLKRGKLLSKAQNFDIDADNRSDALTDGILILRYLFGYTGDSLINGAVADDATRRTPCEIEEYMKSLLPE